MVLDAKMIFCEDEAVSASMTSKVVSLGKNGAVVDPLTIQVNLTKGNTSGSIDTITLQSSEDEAFTKPITEAAYTVASSIDQTKPAVLAQFKSPVKPGGRYVRLAVAGSTPVGGKLTAFYTDGNVHQMY